GRARHGLGPTGGRFLSQVDFPRAREARLTGATWVITTNPWRSAERRPLVLVENLRRLQGILESLPGEFSVVRNAAEYGRAVAAGGPPPLLRAPGGHAPGPAPHGLRPLPGPTGTRKPPGP